MQVKHINREEYKEELDANGSERRNNLKKKNETRIHKTIRTKEEEKLIKTTTGLYQVAMNHQEPATSHTHTHTHSCFFFFFFKGHDSHFGQSVLSCFIHSTIR